MHDPTGVNPPSKSPLLHIRQAEPLNAGPPLDKLVHEFITPTQLFFVRSHGQVPQLDPSDYQLTIDGQVQHPLKLGIADLASFPRMRLTASLQCAGNRRDELYAIGPIPGELPWGADGISTGEWEGVPLRVVLEAAGVVPEAQHIALVGYDTTMRLGNEIPFGGSIPIAKALGSEVLLADRLNGAPLPATHGGPLRLLVPGMIGARSVKWLRSITLQAEPSQNYFQAHAYKLFPPDATAENVDWSGGIMLGDLSITSVICAPPAGSTIPTGSVALSGYAMAGGGRTIERVDITCDGGRSWVQATLGKSEPWAWRLWHAEVQLERGSQQFAVRAWDSAANTQPEQYRDVWNFKGYMNNAWHRIDLIGA